MRFVAIKKQAPRVKRPKPTSRDYEAMHRIADRAAPGLARKLRETVNTFRNSLDVNTIRGAFESGDTEQLYTVLDWSHLKPMLAPIKEDLHKLVRDAGKASEKQIRLSVKPSPTLKLVRKADDDLDVRAELVFDGDAPESERWARERAGTLIQGITDTSIRTVRDALADTIQSGRDYGSSAQRIKDAVGLTTQGAGAVGRFRDMLTEQGASDYTINRRTEAYRERLLKQRAETISRTETIAAVNQGQLTFWEQLIGRGVVNRGDAMKVWVVTPDDRLCPICEPLGGETVGINDKFITSIGSVEAPPAHPNCRCAVSLEIR